MAAKSPFNSGKMLFSHRENMNIPLGPLFTIWKLEMKCLIFFVCSITVLLSLFSSFCNEDHDWLSLGETFARLAENSILTYPMEGGREKWDSPGSILRIGSWSWDRQLPWLPLLFMLRAGKGAGWGGVGEKGHTNSSLSALWNEYSWLKQSVLARLSCHLLSHPLLPTRNISSVWFYI